VKDEGSGKRGKSRLDTPSAPMGPRSTRPNRPARLGRYEIFGKIAKGGMATIYLARDAEKAGGPIAIKVVRHELSDDEQIDRMFLDEAAMLGRLEHPNIVRTLECGVEAGQRFIAMELLLGHTLMDVWKTCHARNVALAPEVVAWIGARIADALFFAHELTDENGAPLHVIHRDVNPTNIFITYEGDLKLFDFGLAKSKGRYTKSVSGIVKGKLPYLSPEQIMQMPLDCRSDLFALGTTMWEVLTARRLFTREDDISTVKAVRHGPIPDVRTIAPHVPTELAAIVHRALERNRANRHTNARELREDLDSFVASRNALDSKARLAAILPTLFPEEYARQMTWLRATRTTTTTPQAMRPTGAVGKPESPFASLPPR
jgi:eukaryotic-like serine/threonine-protein kinase